MPATKAESYHMRPVEELLRNLASWSPVIRERAAIAIAAKEGQDAAIIPALIKMAQGDDANARYGACAAFEQLGRRGAEGVEALTRLLEQEDYWLTAQAAEALAGIGEPARVAIPALLELVADPAHHDDGRGYLQRYLAFALFDQRNGLMGKSLGNVDRQLVRQAAQAVLKNQDGRARGSLKTVYSQLSPEEMKPLLPAVFEAVAEPAPSGVMFSDGIRVAGLEILAEHRIAEGLPLCIDLIELDRWGADNRFKGCLAALREYGGSAKALLPKIREFGRTLGQHPKFLVLEPENRRHNKKMAERYEELLAVYQMIEEAPEGEQLQSLPSE